MTEIIVFGARAGSSAATQAKKTIWHTPTQQAEAEIEAYSKTLSEDRGVNPLTELRRMMWESVGIVRNGAGLEEALRRIEEYRTTAAKLTTSNPASLRSVIETRFATTVAGFVTGSALRREESRGIY